EQHDEVVGAETLADRVGDRAVADGGEPARLLGEEDDAQRAQHDGPRELEAVQRPGLRCGRDRPDVEEAADAGDDAEPDLQELLHGRRASAFDVASSRSTTGAIAARSSCAAAARAAVSDASSSVARSRSAARASTALACAESSRAVSRTPSCAAFSVRAT